MVAYTTTKNLAQVANSSYVGTWDGPTNLNWGIVDAALGQSVTIGLNNSPVVLSAAQYQCAQVTFNSTLTGSVAITFPSTFTGPYIIYNACTGSSLYIVTLQTTVAGGQAIACPPGELFDAFNDGTNLKYRNFGRVGTYWDYAGSSVPAWIAGCTVPPYLNCDGTTFSSATYPTLANLIGTTLPDSRGRFRATLNQTTTRLVSTSGSLDGNTLLAGGGGATTLSSQNIPPVSITDPGHTHTTTMNDGSPAQTNKWQGGGSGADYGPYTTQSGVTGITAGSTSPTSFVPVPPAYVGGLTLIRAA